MTLDEVLTEFRAGGPAEAVIEAATTAADIALGEGRALDAMTTLVRAEAELGAGFGAVRGDILGIRHLERPRVHALLRFRDQLDGRMAALRRAIRFPEDVRRALELEVERGIALSRAFIELGGYASAAAVLRGAELPLDYLGHHPKLRFEWLRQRASWAFAARELRAARQAVRDYHQLFSEAPLPSDEIDAVVDDLEHWLEVAPVRELVADLAVRVRGKAQLEARLLAWDIASTLFFPWDEALEAELEARLREPTVPLLEALVDRVSAALEARASVFAYQPLRPALVEDGGRVLLLLDRLAELADARAEMQLSARARVIAHEHMLDLASAMRPEIMAAMHPVDAARVGELLAHAPWSAEARRARVERLREAIAPASIAKDIKGRALAVMVADPVLPTDEAIATARAALGSTVDEEALDIAAAWVDRAALDRESQEERAGLELARAWLETATRTDERSLAMEAKEILAGALEIEGDLEGALQLFEELSSYFETRDHERWVHAIERCAMLAKQTGRLASAGRALRSGFRPGGRVQAPADDMPSPFEPLQAEEQAERAIAVALRTSDPEVGEAWLRRALLLYERVPDGRRREDEIWERIADLWQAEADALFEAGDASSEQLDEAHRRAHEALVRAIDVNDDLGDGERVFELSGRVLDVLWTWLTRWQDAVEAFLTLARGRFRSAIARDDLDHAAVALFELRAHLSDVKSDASELDVVDEEARSLVARFEELEREMAETVEAETARLGEPWWRERLERRALLFEARFAAQTDDE